MRTAVITGSSGLIGSEAARFFDARGWTVHGVDNNMRKHFFGEGGDTTANLEQLFSHTTRFQHHDFDIRDRGRVDSLISEVRPALIVHCAAQPSHDLARGRPIEDFEVNALATLGILEAVRNHCPEATFVFMSTNKVYGTAPNELPLVELDTRWDYENPGDHDGINESCRIDTSLHSLFGASKLAADILVQEYGQTFDMPTVCFRAGCLTGPQHAGVELHGFLNYLARAVKGNLDYRIYGYKGKQVRDNLHSLDVCEAVLAFHEAPRTAAVYNLGGGRENSVSVLEAINALQELTGSRLNYEYIDEARLGDHICYISDLTLFRADYPRWEIQHSLTDVLKELAEA